MSNRTFCIAAALFGLLNTHAYGADAPKIYGTLFAGIDAASTETTSTNVATGVATTTKTNNNNRPNFDTAGSRIGFKGDHPLNADITLNYQLEYGIKLASERDGVVKLSARDTFVGLESKKYGEIKVGRLTTIDDDIDYVDNAYLYSDTGAPFGYGAQRVSNAIAYYSPKLKNQVQFMAQYAMNEKRDNAMGGTFNTYKNNRPTEIDRDFVVVGVGQEIENKSFIGATYTMAGKDFSSLRVATEQYLTPKLTVAAMGQYTDYNSKDKELGVLVSSTYKVSEPVKVWVQAGTANNYNGYKDGKKTTFDTGVMYYLGKNKKARLFGSLGLAKTQDFEYKDDVLVKNNTNLKSLELGVRYDF